MITKTEIIESFYQDSVILMRIAGQIRKRAGVIEALLFMGTPANQELLRQIGFGTAESIKATANDLIITINAITEQNADEGISAAKDLLVARRQTCEASKEYRARTLESAIRLMPNANLVTISVPGAYAGFEAMKAIRRGLHVFLFSDNIPLEEELKLKKEAVKRGIFCMGPDQGTAYINGIGLGFANVVPRGRIGLIAASGTGMQAVAARVNALGEGISHGIGVGGRDLSQKIGGIMTEFAFNTLSHDVATEAIILISKPICFSAKSKIKEYIKNVNKPVIICCVGESDFTVEGVISVTTLNEAADAAVAVLKGQTWQSKNFEDHRIIRDKVDRINGFDAFAGCKILGLFTGGTLAYESHYLLNSLIGPVGYNQSQYEYSTHVIIDLGDDAFTIGRPHPMIDPQIRTDMVLEMGEKFQNNILLFDLVLGKGAHANPAESIATAVHEIHEKFRKQSRPFIALASIVGTTADPQDLHLQKKMLHDAGIEVFASNAEAARFAALLVRPDLYRALIGDGLCSKKIF